MFAIFWWDLWGRDPSPSSVLVRSEIPEQCCLACSFSNHQRPWTPGMPCLYQFYVPSNLPGLSLSSIFSMGCFQNFIFVFLLLVFCFWFHVGDFDFDLEFIWWVWVIWNLKFWCKFVYSDRTWHVFISVFFFFIWTSFLSGFGLEQVSFVGEFGNWVYKFLHLRLWYDYRMNFV